jgi:hypothetical protein
MKCTGDGGPGAWSDYCINPYLNDPDGRPDAPDANCTLTSITDGTSHTIMIGHGQMRPEDYGSVDITPGFNDLLLNGGSRGLCRSGRSNAQDAPDVPPGSWGGPFPQGSLMCMADGSVHIFTYVAADHSSLPNSFAAFLTPNGKEEVILPN